MAVVRPMDTHTVQHIHVIRKTQSQHQAISKLKIKCTQISSLNQFCLGYQVNHHCKQFICSVIDYASPAWAAHLSENHLQTLQTQQNKSLKIITGCTARSNTDHLHWETKVLQTKDHLDMRGTHLPQPAQTKNIH